MPGKVVGMVNQADDCVEPRWLDEEEADAWLQLARLTIRLPAALDQQLRRDADISHFEYAVLARLSEAPGRTLRMSTLADFANGSLSRLSHVATRLERNGWIRREHCPEDGRCTNATLTDAGHAKVVAAAPGHVAAVRALVIDQLSKAQLRQMGILAGRVVDNISTDSHTSPA
jgi:DNA-binding MarR family transcriptional regulator